jgi:hypothetical protein
MAHWPGGEGALDEESLVELAARYGCRIWVPLTDAEGP